MGIKQPSKAEKFFKENPNADWEELLKNDNLKEFGNRLDYDDNTYLFELMLENEKCKMVTIDYCNGNYSFTIIFDDGSCIELFEESERSRVDAIWSDINDLSTRKEVHYISRNDIIVYTD